MEKVKRRAITGRDLVYVCQILNNKFCKEPRAGKPHAGFCEGHILQEICLFDHSS